MIGYQPYWNATIPDYWLEKGLTMEILKKGHLIVIILMIATSVIAFFNYLFTWWVRKNIDPLKLIGEKPLTRLEKYAQACKLGQEPAMNFISSTLVTNDRVYIVIRLILAFWSSTLNLVTFESEGIRAFFSGSYYLLAICLTIYVNFHRELIIDGFGKKAQMVNKLLSLLLSIMINLQVFIALSWWTKWFGLGYRYRDIQRGFDVPKWLRFQKEFSPVIFILFEVLWFDTMVTFAGVWGPIFVGNFVAALIFADVIIEPPQALGPAHGRPATTMVQGFCWLVAYPFIQLALASFCNLKIWVFKKVPVIGERLVHRQKCAANFLK